MYIVAALIKKEKGEREREREREEKNKDDNICKQQSQKNFYKTTDKEFKEQLLKSRILEKKSQSFSDIFLYFLMFDFCMITDRLTVKVNYILDAQNNRRFNFDTIIIENIEYQTKNTKDMGIFISSIVL